LQRLKKVCTAPSPNCKRKKGTMASESKVWKHFWKENNASICNHCHKIYKYKGASTCRIIRHISHKHELSVVSKRKVELI
jgi:BED zinc finger